MCLVPRCIRSTRRCKRCRGIPFNTTWRSQGYFQAGAIPNGVSAAGNIVVVVSIHPLVCLLASPSRQTCVVMNVYHESVNVGLCLFQSMNSHIVPHPHRYAFRCRRIIQILNENIVAVDGCSQLTPDNFQKMTYWMNFMYGTATKAVRLVPVLYYSERLANSIQHVPSVSVFEWQSIDMDGRRFMISRLFGTDACSPQLTRLSFLVSCLSLGLLS